MKTSSRVLFDQAYLQSNCNKDLISFEKDYMVDNLPWTYWTNYAIGAVCIILSLCIILYRQRQSSLLVRVVRQEENQEETKIITTESNHTTTTSKNHFQVSVNVFVLGYLLWSAFGYIVGGIGHQIIEQKSDIRNGIFQRICYLLINLGTLCLWGEIILLFRKTDNNLKTNETLFWIWLITNLIILTVTGVIGNMMVTGIWLFIGNAIALISYMRTLFIILQHNQQLSNNKKMNRHDDDDSSFILRLKISLIMKSLSMILSMSGLLTQVLLSNTCGDNGYEECFQSCPLSNPKVFNHNALFHIMIMISFLFYGVAELILPSSKVFEKIVTSVESSRNVNSSSSSSSSSSSLMNQESSHTEV